MMIIMMIKDDDDGKWRKRTSWGRWGGVFLNHFESWTVPIVDHTDTPSDLSAPEEGGGGGGGGFIFLSIVRRYFLITGLTGSSWVKLGQAGLR